MEERRADAVSRHEFNAISNWLKEIDANLESHGKEEVKMEQRLEALEKNVAEIKADVKALLEVWTQGKGAIKFISFVIGALAGGWALVTWLKDHITL